MNNVNVSYFNELREQIMNEEKWVNDRFVVYNYEAGSGKSQNTFRFLAEMAKVRKHRVLYVQKFIKEDEMANTVETINDHAGVRVAVGFHSKMNEKDKKKCLEAQILVITHQMYLSVCKGKRLELVKNRDILIIDEHPDLVEKVALNHYDIGNLWMIGFGNHELETITQLLRKKFYQCKRKSKQNIIQYIDFSEKEFEPVKEILSGKNDVLAKIIGKPLMQKLQQILLNGCFFYENSFYTSNNDLKFHFLKNNIILDANAGYDYRYRFSSFNVKTQEKFYNNSTSILQHFQVKTDKTALNKHINLEEKVFQKIGLESKKKTLIITDKENSEIVKAKTIEYFASRGYNDDEIEEMVQVDYFGNLIGVNRYRNYENIVILKTPNFDYLSYALMYFFYQSLENKKIEDITVFKDDNVEAIRKTVVGGEMYQAIKRINRDNSRAAHIVVCTDYQEAMDVVLSQLPGIQYYSETLEVNKIKEKEKPENSKEVRLVKAKQFLLDQINAGVKEVPKKVLREVVGINNSGNFTKTILNNLAPFFIENEIELTNNRLILNKKAS